MSDKEMFERFLQESIGDESAIAELREFVVSLGLGDRPEKALLLCGPGFGKSTLARALSLLVPLGAVSFVRDFDPDGLALWPLKRSRLNICSEALSCFRVSREAEVIKTILSGDPMIVREIGFPDEICVINSGFVFIDNSSFYLLSDPSFSRRIAVLRFDNLKFDRTIHPDLLIYALTIGLRSWVGRVV